MKQTRLDIEISQRTVLVDVNLVRAARGVDAETVFGYRDNGRLRWVWNVSLGREIEELRFWREEVRTMEVPARVTELARLTIDQVIDYILPRGRAWLHRPEVMHLLMVSKPTVLKIGEEIGAPQVDGKLQFPRGALAQWLRARWVGRMIVREVAA